MCYFHKIKTERLPDNANLSPYSWSHVDISIILKECRKVILFLPFLSWKYHQTPSEHFWDILEKLYFHNGRQYGSSPKSTKFFLGPLPTAPENFISIRRQLKTTSSLGGGNSSCGLACEYDSTHIFHRHSSNSRQLWLPSHRMASWHGASPWGSGWIYYCNQCWWGTQLHTNYCLYNKYYNPVVNTAYFNGAVYVSQVLLLFSLNSSQ